MRRACSLTRATATAYGRLSRLLSLGKMRCAKGECDLLLTEVALHAEGIALIAMPGEDLDAFEAAFPALCAALPGMRHVAAAHRYRGDDLARIERLDRLAQGARAAASSPPTTSIITRPSRRPLQDVMTCIREKVTLVEAGLLLNPNAERHLKIAGRDGATVRALAARDRRDARVGRRDRLQPRRTDVRISAGDLPRGAHAAAAAGASDLGGGVAALAARGRRPRCSSRSATSSR